MPFIEDMVANYFRSLGELGETGTMTDADRNRLGQRAVRAPLGRDIFARAERGLGPQGFEQSLDLVYDPGSYSARAGAHAQIPWDRAPTSGFRVGAGVPDVPFIGGELEGTASGQFGSGFDQGQLQYRKSLGELDRELGQFLRARGQGQTDGGEMAGVLNQLAAALFGR